MSVWRRPAPLGYCTSESSLRRPVHDTVCNDSTATQSEQMLASELGNEWARTKSATGSAAFVTLAVNDLANQASAHEVWALWFNYCWRWEKMRERERARSWIDLNRLRSFALSRRQIKLPYLLINQLFLYGFNLCLPLPVICATYRWVCSTVGSAKERAWGREMLTTKLMTQEDVVVRNTACSVVACLRSA